MGAHVFAVGDVRSSSRVPRTVDWMPVNLAGNYCVPSRSIRVWVHSHAQRVGQPRCPVSVSLISSLGYVFLQLKVGNGRAMHISWLMLAGPR